MSSEHPPKTKKPHEVLAGNAAAIYAGTRDRLHKEIHGLRPDEVSAEEFDGLNAARSVIDLLAGEYARTRSPGKKEKILSQMKEKLDELKGERDTLLENIKGSLTPEQEEALNKAFPQRENERLIQELTKKAGNGNKKPRPRKSKVAEQGSQESEPQIPAEVALPQAGKLMNPLAKYDNQGEVIRQGTGELLLNGEAIPADFPIKYHELRDWQQESSKTGDEAEQAKAAEEINSFISGLAKEEDPFDPHSVPSVDESGLNASQYTINPDMQTDMDALSASEAKNALEAEVQRQVAENRRTRSIGKSSGEEIVMNEQERVEINGKSEAKAQRSKLRGLIDKLTGGVKEKFDWYKSSSEKLIRRNEELDAEAEKITGGEKFFRALGERYNKMSFKSKLALGAGLGLGAVLSGAALSLPAMLTFVGLVGVQRTAGLMSMYMKFENASPHGGKRDEKFWQWGQKEKAMAKAIVYTMGMSVGMGYVFKEASETETAHRVQEWLGDTLSKIYGAISSGADTAPSSTFESEMEGWRPVETDSSPMPEKAEAPAQAPVAASGAAQYKYELQAEVRRYSDMMQHAEVPATAPEAPLTKLPVEPRMVTSSELDPYFSPPRVESSIAEGQNIRIGDDIREKALASVASLNQNELAEAASLNVAPGAATASPEASAATTQASPSVEATRVSEPQGFAADSEGAKVLGSEGQPVHTGSFEPVPDTNADVETKPDVPREISPSMEPANEQAPAPVETAVPHAIPESSEAIITTRATFDPSTTRVYEQGDRFYVLGGDGKASDAIAQAYAQEKGVSVFVDETYKLFGFINTPRFIEYTPDGLMVIHKDPALAPDLNALIRPIDIGSQTASVPGGSETVSVLDGSSAEGTGEALTSQAQATAGIEAKPDAPREISPSAGLADEQAPAPVETAEPHAILESVVSPEPAKTVDLTPAQAESARLLAEAKANEAARVAAEKAQEAVEAQRIANLAEAQKAPEPAPAAEAPKAPPVEASKSEAPAPIPSGRVLNSIPTEQLDKMMTPEIIKVAGVRKAEMLALFDMEGSKEGVNSAAWKATANKPIEFLLAVNNSSVMKNLVETGRVDAKYLGKPAEFLKEVLGIEKDAVNSDGFITEKFGKLHSYLYDLALDKRYPGKLIPPLPKETVAAYIERASKVLALKWAR